jgi:thiol:disulfide interchange protein
LLRLTPVVLVALCLAHVASTARAQGSFFEGPSALAAKAGATLEVISLSASFTAPDANHISTLYVQADIKPGWHIYSVTQPQGGPIATRVSFTANKDFVPLGGFKTWPKPEVKTEEAWKDLPIETHEGRVVWYMPLAFGEAVDVGKAKIEGTVRVQACNEQGCLPPKQYKFIATLGKGVKLPPDAEPALPIKTEAPIGGPITQQSVAPDGLQGAFRQSGSHVTLRGQLEPAVVLPGDVVKLLLSAEPEPPYHVYALEEADRGRAAYKPTLIRVDLPANWQADAPRASAEPLEKASGESDGNLQRYYEEPVTWTIELTVPAEAPRGSYDISGIIGYQSCNQTACDRPLAARFTARVQVADQRVGGAVPLAFAPGKYREAAEADLAAKEIARVGADAPAAGDDLNFELIVAGDTELREMSLIWAVIFGFAGGAVLNLMPCVLPVIGLKILSFVEQSGHRRGHVLALNLWYSLGLISVFMVLATLAIMFGLGWGELFKFSQFNIALAAVVFAMSLSFLGVWEIPIPGFIGSGKAGELAAKEGAAGAFAKGAITTVLATPCTGPFLGTALVWAAAKPPALVYTIFLSVGLGMASPYLLIGAFPRLIRWLPKPGAWMETFKQLMGFVLLATLVYLMTLITWSSMVPTLALLFGVWLACWWIGRHQWSGGGRLKALAWMQGLATIAVVGAVSFGWLEPIMRQRHDAAFDARQVALMSASPVKSSSTSDDHIAWQPFSIRSFKALADAEKTIVVDFTAPWCLTCKTLEATVLNSEPVRQLLKANEVVTMQAQWLDEYPETELMLDKLNSKQIPVVAIFPAGDWTRPIVLRGLFPKQQMLEALRQAGRSKATTMVSAAALGSVSAQ